MIIFLYYSVVRIRDVPGSDFFPSRIPDPNCLYPGSRIRIKEFKFITQKRFLSSRKYEPGWSSRILDPDADFLPIPDPGSRGQKGNRSRIWIRNIDTIRVQVQVFFSEIFHNNDLNT